ncbi:MAG TPA: helix-turn-helix domain-containing protein [Candidatus Binatus sp.]|nr:helix-turn-helix domain-containing protein [Candidatus Binatus sp.]
MAPGVELHTDDLPAGVDPEGELDAAQAATMTVADAGKMLRCGETAIRRLIRGAVLRPVPTVDGTRVRRSDVEAVQRAGVLPRSSRRPGE